MVNVGKYTSPMDPADKYAIHGSYGFPGTKPVLTEVCAGVPYGNGEALVGPSLDQIFWGQEVNTPQKINGWNLEMMVSKLGISFSKGPFSGSMFVLGGVFLGSLTAKAPENRPKPKRKGGSSSKHHFSRANC